MSTPPPLSARTARACRGIRRDHFEKRIPDGDNRERLVCGRCEFIHYQNPKIVAGAVCTWDDKILLAKRAIEPRKGFWTLPGGLHGAGRDDRAGGAARGARGSLRHHRDRSAARHVQRGPHRPGADHVSRAAGERRRRRRPRERGSGAGRLGRHPLGAARLPDRGVGARPFPRVARQDRFRDLLQSHGRSRPHVAAAQAAAGV